MTDILGAMIRGEKRKRTLKTKLVQELNRPPVPTGHRQGLRGGVADYRDESVVELTPSGMMAERYRLEAHFTAEFLTDADRVEHDDVRRKRHEMLRRSITEAVYGEVRDEMHYLMKVTQDIGLESDFDVIRAIEGVVARVLEMTQP